jgi:Tol biopolymer transport system component
MAFTSLARLAPEDDNDTSDLYVFDIQSGQTRLESATRGWALRHHPVLYPRISGAGRLIVFQAVDTQGPTWWQTLVLDRSDRSVRVVSVSAAGELANGHCTQATISGDGSTIVFESRCLNFVE